MHQKHNNLLPQLSKLGYALFALQRNNGSFELHLSSFLIVYNVFKIFLKSQLKFYALLHIFAGFTSRMCNVYVSKFQKKTKM